MLVAKWRRSTRSVATWISTDDKAYPLRGRRDCQMRPSWERAKGCRYSIAFTAGWPIAVCTADSKRCGERSLDPSPDVHSIHVRATVSTPSTTTAATAAEEVPAQG